MYLLVLEFIAFNYSFTICKYMQPLRLKLLDTKLEFCMYGIHGSFRYICLNPTPLIKSVSSWVVSSSTQSVYPCFTRFPYHEHDFQESKAKTFLLPFLFQIEKVDLAVVLLLNLPYASQKKIYCLLIHLQWCFQAFFFSKQNCLASNIAPFWPKMT